MSQRKIRPTPACFVLGCLLTLLAGSAAAAPTSSASSASSSAPSDPALWPEDQRAFFQDGPALLLTREQREELLGMDAAARESWISAFLDRDPFPETPENELWEGIRRRQALARNHFDSPLDARYQLAFLNGWPVERQEVDCGMTFRPVEVWRFSPEGLAAGRSIALQGTLQPEIDSRALTRRRRGRKFFGWEQGPRVLVYQPGVNRPYRLWEPYDGKRALYTSDMEYIMEQYEELRNLIQGKRFDLQACPETEAVERATGIEGLTGYIRGRPAASAVKVFLDPPEDLGAWAREAAATPLPDLPSRFEVRPLKVFFPRREGQLIGVRLLVEVPFAPPLAASADGHVELVVTGTLESEGELFGSTRVRYRTPVPPSTTELADGEPVAAPKPLALAIDQALRPGKSFVVRLAIEDETSGATSFVSRGFKVPREPRAEDAHLAYEEAALLGQALAEEARVAAPDSLLLVPALEGQVYLGIWRAQALVTGSSITKVVFLVDGKPQVTVSRAPWSAELRLITHPTEQIIRAEGYDEAGNLIASDEVILNQPRGSFRVGIVQPKKGVPVSGRIQARAEVVVPDDHKVERVEFRVDDEVVATLTQPPWTTEVSVPPGDTAYLSVVAVLDDGRQGEAVQFFNPPKYLEEVDVRLVELYTTVTDRSGRLIRDLGREEFEILEDKRPQEIAKFELVENLPLTIGITIDTSGSMASSLGEAQEAGRAFLENIVTHRDRCFVVGFSGKPTLLMPPTDDVGACVEGLEGLISVGWTALHDAVVTSLYYMRELEGQRALVLLSDGDDTASGISFDDALEFARRSGVVIFPVALNVSALDVAIRRKLSRLAEDTGGRVFNINTAEELTAVYGEIEQELRSRYLLAYASQQNGQNGQNGQSGQEGVFREVEVKVKKRGLQARTIRGYYPGQ